MKIGDYVRSSWGTISKIIEYTPYEDDECFGITLEDETNTFYKHQWQFDNDYKVSSNIIDLIEVGDFIKYNLVQNHYAKKITLYKAIKDERDLLFLKYQVQNDKLKILSIVTKEQFESMEYRIGE